MKNNNIDYTLVVIGILLILDACCWEFIPSLLSILLYALITVYWLLSGVRYRLEEVRRIRINVILYWEYKKKPLDWNSIIFVILFFYGFSQLDGTMKYIILILGIQFLILLVINTLLSRFGNYHILAIEENNIVNIRHKVELLDLSKFQLIDISMNEIRFKDRWGNHVIYKDEFRDSHGLIEALSSKLNKPNVQ